ncbi:hypothetical protein EDC01DRAFT_713240 [Geopyxis carbonaria]|nr:hypothetical protein EDC01DRAFT_713240 [Geopyxis carbonaria]
MQLSFSTILLFATAALAMPPPKAGLRLVKTSADDAGTWVSEAQKFEQYTAKGIHFADVTDTQDLEMLGAARVAQRSVARRQLAAFPTSPSHQSEVAALTPDLTSTTIEGWLETYTAFYNRYYNGVNGTAAADWLFATVQGVAEANPEITVEQFSHAPTFAQQSIIAKIPGTDAAQVVVISAHLDSVGTTRTGRAPGADDNASGSFTILETLRVLAESGYAPQNTLEFHWYAGEEGGLLGSRGVMRSYAAAGVNVVATLNQDMTGYSTNNVMAVIQDYVNAPLSAFVATVVEEYASIPVVTTVCGYSCSDHASANASGYASSFVFEDYFGDDSPYIHSAADTIATINMDHIMEHAKVTLGFAIESSYF